MNHNNPLIQKKQNFVLDSKVLFIDSNDRDIERWPNASEFEINCPQIYNNVESLRLSNIMLPNHFFNISEHLQTNTMIIDFSGQERTIVLEDGYYKHSHLKAALQKKFTAIDSSFVIAYNEINNKYYFGHSSKSFRLLFDKVIKYSTCDKDNYKIDIFSQHSDWGLGNLLGFDKQTYISNITSAPNILSFPNETTRWIELSSNVIVSHKSSNLEHTQFIYIELDKYNKCDEIKPYLYYNYSNANSGIINSAFAKIPFIPSQSNSSLINYGYLDNTSYFQPPIDKIAKLKIRFRYHNGMLVDFQNYNVSLSIEINQLRNEMNNYEVRTPFKP